MTDIPNTTAMAGLPEDADERRMFENMVETLGRPLAVVSNALAIMSRMGPQEGSYAKQLAIYSNECLKAAHAVRAGTMPSGWNEAIEAAAKIADESASQHSAGVMMSTSESFHGETTSKEIARDIRALMRRDPSSLAGAGTMPTDAVSVPRELLQAARDYIGSMPTKDTDGEDRFLSAARVVEPIERLLATTPPAPSRAGTMPSEEGMARLLSRLTLIRHRGDHKTIERNVEALWPQYVDDARAVLALRGSSPEEVEKLQREIKHLLSAAVDRIVENDRLRRGIAEIKQATIDGRVCDDVAWFDTITTLHDFCDELLTPIQSTADPWDKPAVPPEQ